MEFVKLQDVEVVQASDSGLLCQVGRRQVWVPVAHICIADHSVSKPGDRGILIIPAWFARELHLNDQAR